MQLHTPSALKCALKCAFTDEHRRRWDNVKSSDTLRARHTVTRKSMSANARTQTAPGTSLAVAAQQRVLPAEARALQSSHALGATHSRGRRRGRCQAFQRRSARHRERARRCIEQKDRRPAVATQRATRVPDATRERGHPRSPPARKPRQPECNEDSSRQLSTRPRREISKASHRIVNELNRRDRCFTSRQRRRRTTRSSHSRT